MKGIVSYLAKLLMEKSHLQELKVSIKSAISCQRMNRKIELIEHCCNIIAQSETNKETNKQTKNE